MRLCHPALLLHALTALAVQEDDGVLVLTGDNFEAAVAAHPRLLVQFYAPWCVRSKAFAPRYVELGARLAKEDLPVRLAKLDAEKFEGVASRQGGGVRRFPSIKLFKDGRALDYKGNQTVDDMFAWLEKKCRPSSARTLKAGDDLADVLEEHEVTVIGLFGDLASTATREFEAAADTVDEYSFVVTDSRDEVVQRFGINDVSTAAAALVLYNKLDDEFYVMQEDAAAVTADKVVGFARTNGQPLLVMFGPDTRAVIFTGGITTHLLVFFSGIERQDEVRRAVGRAARAHRGRILFVGVDRDVEANKEIVRYFEADETRATVFRLTVVDDNMFKYRPDKDDEANLEAGLEAFLGRFESGQLRPLFKSQELPADWDSGPVKTLVGDNFEPEALSENVDAFVLFHAPWCQQCRDMEPTWQELGRLYGDTSAALVAEVDASLNEFRDIRVIKFPTLLLFKGADRKGLEYTGDKTLQDLKEFVERESEHFKSAKQKVKQEL